MRRIFILIICAVLILLGNSASAKTLVVYYSHTGNCRDIVATLTSQIEADVLEIQPAEKGQKYEANGYALGTQLLNAIKANPNDASILKLFALMFSITAATQETAAQVNDEAMIVRLAEIEVYPQYLAEYLKFAGEVDRLSVEREPGVICLLPMQTAEDSTKIRILEIYDSEEAYQQHLKTDHFQKYKQGTLHMVKDLKLPTMKPLDPETMKLIFTKQR